MTKSLIQRYPGFCASDTLGKLAEPIEDRLRAKTALEVIPKNHPELFDINGPRVLTRCPQLNFDSAVTIDGPQMHSTVTRRARVLNIVNDPVVRTVSGAAVP